MTQQSVGSAYVPEWDVADRMKKALRSSGVGVGEMADYLGVTRNSVGNWINGRIPPSTQTLRLWALRTNIPLEWLEHGDAPVPAAVPERDLTRAAEKTTAPRRRRRATGTLRETPRATGTDGAAEFRCTAQSRRQLRGREVSRPHRRHAPRRPSRCPQNWGRTAERRFGGNRTTPSGVRPIRFHVDAA